MAETNNLGALADSPAPDASWQQLSVVSGSALGFLSFLQLLAISLNPTSRSHRKSWLNQGFPAQNRILTPPPVQVSGSSPKSRMDVKENLIGQNAGQLVEMTYWFIKFVGDFEKQYGKQYGRENWYHDNAATVIKYARYVIKFITSYEKLFNNQR